jgi:hypothetical protein
MTVKQVGVGERFRFRAVLLDEFQDTSEAQLQLLRSLFVAPGAAVPVTAVGDPHQSIYGWRGASSTTLHRFRADFVDDAGPTEVLPLSTSWRNDRAVLEVANHVAQPLTRATSVPVHRLGARTDAGPRARRDGSVVDAGGRGRARRRLGAGPAFVGRGAPRRPCCVANAPSSTRSSRRWRSAVSPTRSWVWVDCSTRRRSPTSSPCSGSCRTRVVVTG